MADDDPYTTQRDAGLIVVSELEAAGFTDAVEVGRGGFGIVFRCRQVGLDRVVAVKVLTAEHDEDRQRFLREQRAMGLLTGHPNIVGVLQVGQTEGRLPYLVMQFHREGSLGQRLHQRGRLPIDDALRMGVKMAGALETAHRAGILHRDVKPTNILYTDYGEPALSDFGIAHITGGFETATGIFTGSPAFTAPETLSGDPPTQASDVYGLGATLFAALTGHAAFERRSGEQVVAQFLRIATESAPDLRDNGIPDDVAAVVDMAMAREPRNRPSALELGESLQQVQAMHGLPVDEMALRASHRGDRPARATGSAVPPRRERGGLPVEVNSFVGRHEALAEVTQLLKAARLVTLTGIGGIGKTRLALRAAAESANDFADGVRLVELGELRDGAMLVDAVSTALGLRGEAARPSREVLGDFLFGRQLLLVVDNCEQVIDAAAKLVDSLLRTCPRLHVLATSRERLGIGGEALFPLSRLTSHAVQLFADRAAAAVPDFHVTPKNEDTIAQICSRLDGLPLAIELAAARLRAMSPEQLLQRLDDRYALLTQGNRVAPARQQTLSWSIGWSYELCTPAEQRLWSRLSVFAGSFELEAAEYVCADGLLAQELDNLLTSLVDKSIVVRTERNGVIRFRLIDTLREYGRAKIESSTDLNDLRRRHLDWYRQLADRAAADWFGPRQLSWVKRLESEVYNLREALEFALSDAPELAVELAARLYWYGVARGALTETRRWLDRALDATPPDSSKDRITALYAAAVLAGGQGDVSAVMARAAEAQVLADQITDPVARGLAKVAQAFSALLANDYSRVSTCIAEVLASAEDPLIRVSAMILQGWRLQFQGDTGRALVWQEKALAVSQAAGEVVFRSILLWSLGVGWWRHGKPDRAEGLLRQCLGLAHQIDDPRNAAACLEAMGWIAGAKNDPRRAAVLMGAAEALMHGVGASPAVLPDLAVFHEECVQRTLETLGAQDYSAVREEGAGLDFDAAVAYVLDAPTREDRQSDHAT
ncbi:protein kinase domain-containing protein [Mycobacterium colombiense]